MVQHQMPKPGEMIDGGWVTMILMLVSNNHQVPPSFVNAISLRR